MSSAKYVPPHLRGRKGRSGSTNPSPAPALQLLATHCGPRCQQWLESPDHSYCPYHTYLSYPDTLALAKYYESHADNDAFGRWSRARQSAETNRHVQILFRKKIHIWSSPKPELEHRARTFKSNDWFLFNKFIRYAVDIDNGTNYLSLAHKKCEEKGGFAFLDLNFAPGGISECLSDCHPLVTGVGVTQPLDRSEGKFVYPEFFDHHDRFKVMVGDVCVLARENADLAQRLDGFDLVITGIAMPDYDNMELKDLLHISQLFLALKHLRPGGSVLIRGHLSLRLIDLHILSCLLDSFAKVTATKPLTEFSIRKTYWLLMEEFNADIRDELLSRLRAVISANSFGAAYRQPSAAFQDVSVLLCEESQHQILQRQGRQIVQLLTPVWRAQTQCLQEVLDGRSSALCNACRSGKGRCYRRCEDVVVLRKVWDAVKAVESRLRPSDRNSQKLQLKDFSPDLRSI